MYAIREASPEDVLALAALMRGYMRETYNEEWQGSLDGLHRHGFGAHFRSLVAVRTDEAVGFLAWEKAYDLHHCLNGGHILDLYVATRHRGRGIAVQLIARAAGIVQGEGGAFLRGGAVDSGTGSRMYARFAPAFGNDFILGGKAFRHLAERSTLPIRNLARSMPAIEWNFEP